MQAGPYFPKVRRMLLCFSPFTFGQPPRCFAGTLLLPLCLLLRPVLKFWSVGATLIRFTWANKSVRAKDFGLECLRDVQRLSSILQIGSVSVCELFRKIDEDFGGSMSWNTQPNCRVSVESYTTGPWRS